MTPEERAEKIHGHFHQPHQLGNQCEKFIVDQIREAEEDAISRIITSGEANSLWCQAYGKGRSSMREEAAKKAFSLSSPLESKSPIVEAQRNTADAIGHMIRDIPLEGK